MAIDQKMYPNGPVAPDRQNLPGMKGRQGYPDISQMPELDSDVSDPSKVPEDLQGENNPIIGALKTLQVYTAKLESNKDPRANAMKESLLGIIKTVAGAALPQGVGEQPEPNEEPEEEAPKPMGKPMPNEQGAAPGAPINKGAMMRAMGRDNMNAGKGSVPLI